MQFTLSPEAPDAIYEIVSGSILTFGSDSEVWNSTVCFIFFGLNLEYIILDDGVYIF